MASKAAQMRNVGTPEQRESWIHARTVALLYDELTRVIASQSGEVRVRLGPGGDISHDLAAGVATVTVPGEWDSIGGVVPDLILYDGDQTPIRIIEVVVTHPPDARKRAKLKTLTTRGVDVVEIVVRPDDNLLDLCWAPVQPRFSALDSRTNFSVNIATNQHRRSQVRAWDKTVRNLTQAIQNCSPQARREFAQVCRGLASLDSLFPIHPSNPLKEKLAEPNVHNR